MSFQGSLPPGSGQYYDSQPQYQYPQGQNAHPQYAYGQQSQFMALQPQVQTHQHQPQHANPYHQHAQHQGRPVQPAGYQPVSGSAPTNLTNANANNAHPAQAFNSFNPNSFDPRQSPYQHQQSPIQSPIPASPSLPYQSQPQSQTYGYQQQTPQYSQQYYPQQQQQHAAVQSPNTNNYHQSYSRQPQQQQQQQQQQHAPSPQFAPQQFVHPNDVNMGQAKSTPVMGQPSPTPQIGFAQQQQQQQTQPPTTTPAQSAPPPPPPPQEQQRFVDPSSILHEPRRIHSGSQQNSPVPTTLNSPAPVARSPALSKKSPAISSRHSPATSSRPSPSVSSKLKTFDRSAVLVHVAEECLAKAHSSLPRVVGSLHDRHVRDYQKLISTGLACLDAAIHSNKLSPRQEAKARLRYASILYEETENLQEAEITLLQGIKLCEKHHFADLKYCMQYVSLRVLYQRNPKAAFIALDKQIADCQTYKHYPWVYAFRLLKTTLQTFAGGAPDSSLIENLHALSTLAHNRDDHALGVTASLLEGLAHLRTTRPDTVERVQSCIAQVAKYQLEPDVQNPQLDVLALLLDLACSMQHKNPDMLVQKLSLLQQRLDNSLSSEVWTMSATELRIPIKKQHYSPAIVTEDTGSVLRPGAADEPRDFVVMTFLTKVELFLLVHIFSGLAVMYKPGSSQTQGFKKSTEHWGEGLDILQRWTGTMVRNDAVASASLQDSIRQTRWRTETFCYLQLLIGLFSATQSKWTTVERCVAKLQQAAGPNVNEIFGLLSLYLNGVYHQGTGDLEMALTQYEDAHFDVDGASAGPGGGRKPAKLDICILAALNRAWILQQPAYFDEPTVVALLDKLRPICSEHHDLEIRTAFNLVQATVQTNPPPSMHVVKSSIQSAIQWTQKTGNVHCLSIALNIMRCRLFENVVGEQALKSAKAGSAQARKSGNLLWMSVADGMLAESLEVQGQVAEAQSTRSQAAENGNRAFTGRE